METGTVKIVYVVMVGGRAVPAAVAARDMRLVRDAEVAKELGAVVTTKAERESLTELENILLDVTLLYLSYDDLYKLYIRA